ncbi:MAG: ABC transporter ATP-binding protein [Candidatus Fimadaptatus sp.]|jgi:ATP-binding cassette subfamily B protein
MIKRFIPYYKPHLKLFLFDFACAIALALLSLVFPRAVNVVMDTLLPAGELKPVLLWGALLAALYVLQYLLQMVVEYWGHIVGVRIEKDMRHDLFEHVHQLPFSYFDNTKTGQIMSRIVNDLNEIAELAHHGPEDFLISVCMLIGTFTIMATMSWKLTLILLCIVPFMLFFSSKWNKRMRAGFTDMRAELGEINAGVEDSLSGVRVVKSFTNEDYENAKFEAGNQRFTKVKANTYYVMARFHTMIGLFSNAFYLVTLIGGAYFVLKGEMSAGNLTAFILYVNLFLSPLQKITNLIETYQRGMASFTRFTDIMDIKPAIEDRPGAKPMSRPNGDIRFEHVSFRYNDSQTVLDDLNFEIYSGHTVALVGPSGGGKTTLCNLIPRFYDVTGGRILIDGQDIRDVTLKSLRENIGIVQQDVFLFGGTVRENILYGRPGASDEDVIAAAKLADAHDFIMHFPEGYDTVVGQRGVKLSGGQKQRIAIARIFLKNPPILLLDEATSALDNETERIIQRSLSRLSENRTSLVIAHRLATIRNADCIFVMTDEGIVESGNHQQLLEKNGLYARLYNSQFEGLEG